ncbi:MDR family MFS transporter [Metabacillus niabensis]|uniref:MDR family MFS transporter n=1 Tax=Metabacillus niabensis TaxID=324854 RepID=UPI0039A250F1
MTSIAYENTKDESKINYVAMIAVLIISTFIAVLNETILNVALSNIMSAFNVSYSTVQWLVTGYLLVIGTLVPISAFFLQRFTTRQLFISAMVFFTLGTFLAAFSSSFVLLLIGRLVQAVGTALLIPLLTNSILLIVPEKNRGLIMGGLISLVFMFAPAIGPTLSGIIVESLSWRWIFFLSAPISLLTLIFGLRTVRNVTETSNPKLDIISYVLSVIGFGGIVFGFASAGEGEASFSDPKVMITIAFGAVGLVLFIIRQLRIKEPLLEIRVFRYPMFGLSMLLVIGVMMTMFPLTLQLPIYFQGVLLFSAFTAGILMLPGGLVNALVAPIMGRIFDKFGPRPLIAIGAVLFMVVIFMFRYIPELSTGMIIFLHCMLMLALGTMMMPAQTNALNQLPKDLYPHGSAIANTLLQIAGALGVPLFITISENAQRDFLEGVSNPTQQQLIDALTNGIQTSFSNGLYFAIAVVVLAIFIKRK